MRKTDIDHIQRSRFLESGKKLKSQVENIVQAINLKYPELAGNIEIPQGIFNQKDSFGYSENANLVYKYLNILINKNLLA
ncbi:MAG TPA: hypothetical protein VK212_08640 [Lentimicrobium sp.]|nr:hypothetical protein [Lentimicrobium sp.]